MDAAPFPGHSIRGRCNLFVIPDIGPEPQRDSAAILNFQLSDVQFTLTASQKTDSGPVMSKPDRQALADATPGTCDQNIYLLG
jgi:hypothetical protein